MDDLKRTLYDAVQENFNVLGRKHYLHRIIYIGEHKFMESRDAFKQYMAQKIKTLHGEYCDEELTGFLLAYPAHFVHLTEGSEATLMRHIRHICEDDSRLARVRVLLVVYHINQRYFFKWGSSICHPPVLFEKLDPECSLEETARQTKVCLSKICRLAKTLSQHSTTDLKQVTEHLSDKYPALLPECALLDFLLGSRTLRHLRDYSANYRQLPTLCAYDDTVWPITCEYIPTNVLSSLPAPKTHVQTLAAADTDEDDNLLASDTLEEEEEDDISNVDPQDNISQIDQPPASQQGEESGEM